MKLQRLIDKGDNLIVLNNNQIINSTEAIIENNHFLLKNGGEFLLVFDNFDLFLDFDFEISANQDIKLYLLSFQTRKQIYSFNYKIQSGAKLSVFSNFSASRKTSLDLQMSFSLEEDSQLKLVEAIVFNGKFKMSQTINLLGKNAEAKIDVLNIGTSDSNFIVKQKMTHQNKNTTSNITNWLITKDNSKMNYVVIGKIEKGHEFSKCTQSNKGIMLSDNSEIQVEPTLLIDEYNVEASHGAAIGQIDELQLYYLLSRGLTEKEAKSLIISGYTVPFIKMIENQMIADYLMKLTQRLIKGE